MNAFTNPGTHYIFVENIAYIRKDVWKLYNYLLALVSFMAIDWGDVKNPQHIEVASVGQRTHFNLLSTHQGGVMKLFVAMPYGLGKGFLDRDNPTILKEIQFDAVWQGMIQPAIRLTGKPSVPMNFITPESLTSCIRNGCWKQI